MKLHTFIGASVLALPALGGNAEYRIDPNHTHPLIEADHMNGRSVWRGLFRHSSGTITLDREGHRGTVHMEIDTTSVDFGLDKLNDTAKGPALLDTANFPTATYKGALTDFTSGAPTGVKGTLTLHGVTQPLTLRIESFKCMVHPYLKREVCGADATGTFDRKDFGITGALDFGTSSNVNLRIQVEAVRAE